MHKGIVCVLLAKHYLLLLAINSRENQCNFSNESFSNINPIIIAVLKYPKIQRNAKTEKLKSSNLPKHLATEQALTILKQKENKNVSYEVVKEVKHRTREQNSHI